MEELNTLFSNPAVIWFIIGLVMLILEFVLPGLIILFFGIGCWVASLGILIFPEMSLNTQLLTFIVSSVLSLLLFRNTLKKWLGQSKKEEDSSLEEYVGKHCTAETDFSDGIAGTVTFKGAQWQAHSDQKVSKGDILLIKKVDSIHLIVEPI